MQNIGNNNSPNFLFISVSPKVKIFFKILTDDFTWSRKITATSEKFGQLIRKTEISTRIGSEDHEKDEWERLRAKLKGNQIASVSTATEEKRRKWLSGKTQKSRGEIQQIDRNRENTSKMPHLKTVTGKNYLRTKTRDRNAQEIDLHHL